MNMSKFFKDNKTAQSRGACYNKLHSKSCYYLLIMHMKKYRRKSRRTQFLKSARAISNLHPRFNFALVENGGKFGGREGRFLKLLSQLAFFLWGWMGFVLFIVVESLHWRIDIWACNLTQDSHRANTPWLEVGWVSKPCLWSRGHR